jgi:hypothetical protein
MIFALRISPPQSRDSSLPVTATPPFISGTRKLYKNGFTSWEQDHGVLLWF